jgi:hypothetical protein
VEESEWREGEGGREGRRREEREGKEEECRVTYRYCHVVKNSQTRLCTLLDAVQDDTGVVSVSLNNILIGIYRFISVQFFLSTYTLARHIGFVCLSFYNCSIIYT